jgi:type II secretory ATPase GspE/PulE/Tfp pilus assembly ATPase PilB-like protein
MTHATPSDTATAATPQSPEFDVSKLPVESATAKLIDRAATLKASDLFFVTDADAVHIQARALGIVQPLATASLDNGRRYIAHIKARAGMDTAERRRPLDGRWIYTDSDGESVDLRINMIPTMHGEDLAIRLVPRDPSVHSLENLGLMPEQFQQVTNMVDSLGGLILITGPTGSGKTATSYACLRRLNDGQRKLNTIEDPVEYTLAGLRQSQVNPAVGLGFADLLRAVLRQSPDVIMIGEIRDTETAQTATYAANAGTLVFATVHSAHAAAAIQALRGLGVPSHFLSTALRGVIAQRLVRTLCPQCKTSFDLDDAPGTFEEIKSHLKPGEGTKLHGPRGCAACNQTGYSAQTGVFEVLQVSKRIASMIAEGRPPGEIRNRALSEKMLSFRQAALLKVARGLTSTEEVFRNIPPEHLLLDE